MGSQGQDKRALAGDGRGLDLPIASRVPGLPELKLSEVFTMQKSTIHHAVEASFSEVEFEKALRKEISEALDYRLLARAVLTKFGIKDIAEAVAEQEAIDILESF